MAADKEIWRKCLERVGERTGKSPVICELELLDGITERRFVQQVKRKDDGEMNHGWRNTR